MSLKNLEDPIVHRLSEVAKGSPDLKDAAEIYMAILPLLRDADLHASALSLTQEEATQKLEKGVSLLYGVDLDLDAGALHELMLRLAMTVEKISRRKHNQTHLLSWMGGSRGPVSAAQRLREAVEENRLDICGLLPQVASGDREALASKAESLGLDPGLVWVLSRNALKPALYAWRRQLMPMVGAVRWQKGICPVCGAGATLGELQGNDQSKHLRCGQCGADWPLRRLQCMYCGNDDHKTLSCLYAEGRYENTRVEVCDRCNGYLKVIAAFSPTPPEMLPVEDLATLHLDYIAQGRGKAQWEQYLQGKN